MLSSLLDSDLYKFSMQQAVLEHHPDSNVCYRFTNRGSARFSRLCYDAVNLAISHLSELALTQSELEWLQARCLFFTPSYLAYLSAFRFRPEEQVRIAFIVEECDTAGLEWGRFEVEVKGLWLETILYEVPLMAIISEAYFTTDDTKWDYQGQFASAKAKGKKLFESGCIVSEFGTRRRRTLQSHEIVMRGLISANEEYSHGNGKGKLAGTSNVHFAQKYGLAPIGTIAHEWMMGIAAIEGYEGVNGRAMDLWDITYPSGALSIALTDTFSSKPFFADFSSNPQRARRWRGLRQDSGDPHKFITLAKDAFEKTGSDPKTKMIVFSDGLDIDRCVALKKASDLAGVGCSFGVGTFFTNDYRRSTHPVTQEVPGEGEFDSMEEQSPALNMVIKLYMIDGKYAVKISDELSKNTGNAEEIKKVKAILGIDLEEAKGNAATS